MKTQAFYLNVDSTNRCEVGKTYSTTNYKMLKPLKYNRGEDNSIVAAKLNAFKKLYESGGFFLNIVHVIINLHNEIIDGHHRLKMCECFGIPVNFIINPQAEFNEGSLSDKLNAISKLNAFNSKWDGKANFSSAVQTKETLALSIVKLQAEINAKYGINPKVMTASRIVALLTEDETGLAGKSLDRNTYCRKDYLKIMKSDKFSEEMEFVCNVIEYILNWNMRNPEITPFFVIRNIMPKIWNNKENMKEFYHKMTKTSFRYTANSMKSVGNLVEEICAKKVQKNTELITW